MAVGLPKNIALTDWRKYPKPVKNNLGKIYSLYLPLYLKTYCRIKYSQEKAKINPLHLLWINPQKVDKIAKYSKICDAKDIFTPKIIDGNWDKKHVKPLNKNHTYNSLKQRFEENAEWSKTPLYKKEKDRIKKESSMYGCKNIKDLENVCKRIDKLHKNIKEHGYKTQKELKHNDRSHEKEYIDYYLNNLNEVILDIDREGKLALHDGRHRLSIAKILGLQKIPVRILIRHKKWQQKRNTAVENPKKLLAEERKHPDIKELI